jgi:hypothetical protein
VSGRTVGVVAFRVVVVQASGPFGLVAGARRLYPLDGAAGDALTDGIVALVGGDGNVAKSVTVFLGCVSTSRTSAAWSRSFLGSAALLVLVRLGHGSR